MQTLCSKLAPLKIINHSASAAYTQTQPQSISFTFLIGPESLSCQFYGRRVQ